MIEIRNPFLLFWKIQVSTFNGLIFLVILYKMLFAVRTALVPRPTALKTSKYFIY